MALILLELLRLALEIVFRPPHCYPSWVIFPKDKEVFYPVSPTLQLTMTLDVYNEILHVAVHREDYFWGVGTFSC